MEGKKVRIGNVQSPPKLAKIKIVSKNQENNE